MVNTEVWTVTESSWACSHCESFAGLFQGLAAVSDIDSSTFLLVMVGARGQENTLSSAQTNWTLSPLIGMLGSTLLHVIAESDRRADTSSTAVSHRSCHLSIALISSTSDTCLKHITSSVPHFCKPSLHSSLMDLQLHFLLSSYATSIDSDWLMYCDFSKISICVFVSDY